MSAVDVSPLPIDAAMPDLTAALRANTAAVLVAPPGAGKTTRVPLVLAREDWAQTAEKKRRILVLEPRRLAARTVAQRIADLLDTGRKCPALPIRTVPCPTSVPELGSAIAFQ